VTSRVPIVSVAADPNKPLGSKTPDGPAYICVPAVDDVTVAADPNKATSVTKSADESAYVCVPAVSAEPSNK
jgi:hypothetical protein